MNAVRARLRRRKRGGRALWVDDHIGEFVDMAESGFQERGYKLACAKSAEEGIGILELDEDGGEDPYDMFLVDLDLGQGNPTGLDFLTLAGDYIQRHKTQVKIVSSNLRTRRFKANVARLANREGFDEVQFVPSDFEAREVFHDSFIPKIFDQVGATQQTSTEAISFEEYLEMPVAERVALSDAAALAASDLLDDQREKGYRWVLYSMPDLALVDHAKNLRDVWADEDIHDESERRNQPLFQHIIAPEPEECSGGNLQGYPTVTLVGDGRTEDSWKRTLHFDTGASDSFLSLEDLEEEDVVKKVSMMSRIHKVDNSGNVVSTSIGSKVNLTAEVKSQNGGDSRPITLHAWAVYQWVESPYIRLCHIELCDDLARRAGNEPCRNRLGLIGHNLLVDNQLAIVVDGMDGTTYLP